jgi:hypothetical protein
LLVGAVCGAACLAPAQDAPEGLKKHSAKVIATSSAPVTQSEARAVFAKAGAAIRKALNIEHAQPPVSIPSGSAPVRREQVIGEMARIYTYILPKVKLTPMPVKYDPAVLKIEHSESGNLNMFVRIGAVGRVSPLATGPSDTLTVPQFGDALGFFLARMTELTHMPSNKWTPELQPGAGG